MACQTDSLKWACKMKIAPMTVAESSVNEQGIKLFFS